MSSKLVDLRIPVLVLLVCILSVPFAYGQNKCTGSEKVSCVIPNLFSNGGGGIFLANPDHNAHFQDPANLSSNFLPLSTAVASQLTLLPLPSPASGFTFEIDRATGVRTPSRTLGPILAERGETIGERKAFIGFSYQRFRFDEIDGNKLGALPIVFTHTPDAAAAFNPGGNYSREIITSDTDIDLKINQFIFFGSFGLRDTLDVSVAVPLLDVSLDAVGDAAIQRLSPNAATCFPNQNIVGSPVCHYFGGATVGEALAARTTRFTKGSSATGIGDITVRVKQNVYNSSAFSAAILADVRLPTGDEEDFLGAGAVGVKPFVALSWKRGLLSPHVNVGFQWNGDSVLAGDILAGTKARLPKQFLYAVGTEIRATDSITVSADWIGQRVFDSNTLQISDVSARLSSSDPNAVTTFQTISFAKKGIGLNDASFGLKYGLKQRFQFTFNGLVSIDDGGVRQKFTPMFGVSFLL